ncbi:hypothetical protein, partial [Brooklawnia sp.]|uniref:hypothetical protein n=1 Tax=Brooklawnia sp. TaxID=2699740 RepID=UPI00311D48F9
MSDDMKLARPNQPFYGTPFIPAGTQICEAICLHAQMIGKWPCELVKELPVCGKLTVLRLPREECSFCGLHKGCPNGQQLAKCPLPPQRLPLITHASEYPVATVTSGSRLPNGPNKPAAAATCGSHCDAAPNKP